MTAILAGVLIGIGDIANITSQNNVVGALLFSVALLSIIRLRLPLYTGRIGKVIANKNPLECLKILWLNIMGVALTTGAVIVFGDDLVTKLDLSATAKFSKGNLSLFVAGIMCNVLIHIAVSAKSEVITILCVMAFILSGYEHSIADVMFALASGNLIKWAIVVTGNTVGGILTEFLLRGGTH